MVFERWRNDSNSSQSRKFTAHNLRAPDTCFQSNTQFPQAHIKPPQELPTNPDEYDIPQMDLPPQWKFAIDSRGKLYYYHVKIRIPQWDPPIKILPLRDEQTQRIDEIKAELGDDSESDGKDDSLTNPNVCNEIDSDKDDDSEESSDAIDSSEDELMQKRQQLLSSFQANQTDLGKYDDDDVAHGTRRKRFSYPSDISANLAVEISAMATTSDKSSMDESTDLSFNLDSSLMLSLGKKKNRDGLATERLISVSFGVFPTFDQNNKNKNSPVYSHEPTRNGFRVKSKCNATRRIRKNCDGDGKMLNCDTAHRNHREN